MVSDYASFVPQDTNPTYFFENGTLGFLSRYFKRGRNNI